MKYIKACVGVYKSIHDVLNEIPYECDQCLIINDHGNTTRIFVDTKNGRIEIYADLAKEMLAKNNGGD